MSVLNKDSHKELLDKMLTCCLGYSVQTVFAVVYGMSVNLLMDPNVPKDAKTEIINTLTHVYLNGDLPPSVKKEYE